MEGVQILREEVRWSIHYALLLGLHLLLLGFQLFWWSWLASFRYFCRANFVSMGSNFDPHRYLHIFLGVDFIHLLLSVSIGLLFGSVGLFCDIFRFLAPVVVFAIIQFFLWFDFLQLLSRQILKFLDGATLFRDNGSWLDLQPRNLILERDNFNPQTVNDPLFTWQLGLKFLVEHDDLVFLLNLIKISFFSFHDFLKYSGYLQGILICHFSSYFFYVQ